MNIIESAKEAGFGNYAYEAASIFERFAAIIRAQAMEELGNRFENQNAEYFGHEIQDAIESMKGQPWTQ